MIKRLSMGFLVGALGLGAGCGSGESAQYKDCDKDGFICDARGLPFVSVVGAVTDYCAGLVAECLLDTKNPPPGATTAHLTKPDPATGRVCLSGTVGTGGWAAMVLPFSTVTPDGNRYLTNLNADALGITEVDFTIDSPLTGIVVAGAATTPPPPLDCPNASCFTGFDLETAPLSGVRATFMQPGPEVAPFVNFENSGGTAFDTSSLEHVQFGPAGPGDYDFCISALKFRNAAGNEVTP